MISLHANHTEHALQSLLAHVLRCTNGLDHRRQFIKDRLFQLLHALRRHLLLLLSFLFRFQLRLQLRALLFLQGDASHLPLASETFRPLVLALHPPDRLVMRKMILT